ncbi:MAG: TolC family protein [Spirochaetales bacterium]|nr:TolC family protein [Spirochaetales bacterium]
MIKIIRFLMLLIILSLPLSAGEIQPPVLNLDVKTAVDMAEKHNYTLKKSMLDLETRKTSAEASWTTFYPNTSLSSSLSISQSNTLSAGAGLSLNLSAGMGYEINQLWNAYESGQLTYTQARAKLAVQVKKYYYSLVLYKMQLDLLQKQSDAAAERLKTAEYKVSIGLFSEIDKLSVEYTDRAKQYALKAMENTCQTSLMQFKQILGIDQKTEVLLTEKIPETSGYNLDSVKNSVADVTSGNLDLKLLYLSLAAAQFQRDASVASLFPTVSLGANVSYGFQNDPFSSSVFDAGAWNQSLSFRIGVSIPIDAYLPYSSVQRNIMNQESEIKKLTYSIQDWKETTEQQADTLLLTVSQIESQINSLKVNIDLAEQNYDLTEQLYNNGKKSFLDLKDSENNLYDAQVQLINAKFQYLSNVLDLEYLLNTDLGL